MESALENRERQAARCARGQHDRRLVICKLVTVRRGDCYTPGISRMGEQNVLRTRCVNGCDNPPLP